MSTALWPETRRIIAQWVGVALASIISGVLLGILLRQNMNDKLALEIALPVGFLLALLFWIWGGRWLSVGTTRITVLVPVSSAVPNFEGDLTIRAYLYQVPPTIPTMANQAPQFEAV